MPDLLLTSCVAVKVVLLALAAGTALLVPGIVRSFADVGRRTWISLAVLLATYLAVGAFLVPHDVWQPNNHGAATLGALLDASPNGEMSPTHGCGNFVLMYGLHRYVFLGLVSPLTVSFMLSAASLGVFFLLARRLLGRDLPALAAVATLALLPVRLRVAATEGLTIPVELFLGMTLLHLVLWCDTRQARFFLAGLASLVLMMQTRVEFLVLGPLLALGIVLVRSPGAIPGVFRSRACLAGLAVAAVALVPWALRMVAQADPRFGQAPGAAISLLTGPGDRLSMRSFLSPFFDPAYATPLFALLFVAGTWALFREGGRRALVFALGAALPLTAFYGIYSDSISTHVRTHVLVQPLFAIVAGAGAAWIADRFRRSTVRAGILAGLGVAGLGSLVPYAGFLSAVSYSQAETRFLLDARVRLPPGAAIVALTAEDDPQTSIGRVHQRDLLVGNEDVLPRRVVGIRAFLDGRAGVDGRETFFYRGAGCHVYPLKREEEPPAPDPTWEHPLCLEMLAHATGGTWGEAVLPTYNNGFPRDVVQGEAPVVGLYRIGAAAPSGTSGSVCAADVLVRAAKDAGPFDVRRVEAVPEGAIVVATMGREGQPVFIGIGVRSRGGRIEAETIVVPGTGRNRVRPSPEMKAFARQLADRVGQDPDAASCAGLASEGDDWAARVEGRLARVRDRLVTQAEDVAAQLNVPLEDAWRDERLLTAPGPERWLWRALGRGRWPLALDPILFPLVFFGVPIGAIVVRLRRRVWGGPPLR